MATDLDDWLGIAELVAHSKLSDKTIRRAIAAREHPLPCHRVGRRVLVKRSVFDAWVAEGAAPTPRTTAGESMDARVARALARSNG